MNLPHDLRLLAHEFFAKALRKWGFQDQLIKMGRASANLQVLIIGALLEKQTKEKEANLLLSLAENEVYIHQLIKCLNAESEFRVAINNKLEELTNDVLEKK